MNNNKKQPQEYDLVLGGNNSPPLNALVLGGIEGIKRRFSNANSNDEKIAILREALKYGEAGEDFLSDVFSISKGKIQWIAAAFISATKNETYKELLVDYFADFIINNFHNWNTWRKEIPNIKIHLKGIKFNNLTEIQNRDFSNTNLINADLSYVDLYKCNFSNANLCQANLSWSNLGDTNFHNAKLIGANLERAFLSGAELRKTDLRKANIEFTSFGTTLIDNIKIDPTCFNHDFESSRINNLVFRNIVFNKSTFRHTILTKVNFINCNLENICFRGVLSQDDIYENCNLIDAEFSYCQSKNNKVSFRNSNLENADFRFSDLRGFVFENVNLKGVDFRWSDLTGVDFTGLDVSGANFTRCTFGNNNLRLANTEGAKFNSIDSPRFPPGLESSNLKGALFDDQYYYEPGYE